MALGSGDKLKDNLLDVEEERGGSSLVTLGPDADVASRSRSTDFVNIFPVVCEARTGLRLMNG